MHGKVGGYFADLFRWGRENNVRIERWMFGVAAGIAVAFLVTLAARLRRAPSGATGRIALLAALWALVVIGLERYLLYIQSELVHFVQYGAISFLLAPLLGP